MDLSALTIQELRRRLLSREVSATEAVRGFLHRIQADDARLNSYVTVLAEEALEEAARYDNGQKDLEASPLAAVPLSIKDVICTRGVRTTVSVRDSRKLRPPL